MTLRPVMPDTDIHVSEKKDGELSLLLLRVLIIIQHPSSIIDHRRHHHQHVIEIDILIPGWWYGTFFLHVLGFLSSQLTFIFFRGAGQPPSRYMYPQLAHSELPKKLWPCFFCPGCTCCSSSRLVCCEGAEVSGCRRNTFSIRM